MRTSVRVVKTVNCLVLGQIVTGRNKVSQGHLTLSAAVCAASTRHFQPLTAAVSTSSPLAYPLLEGMKPVGGKQSLDETQSYY
jgi:hypothetical protein